MGDISMRATGFPQVGGCSPSLSWVKFPKYCWEIILPNIFLFLFLEKEKLKIAKCFLRVKFDKSCREFVLQNRSQSVCISLVKFCFTHA